MSVFVRASAAAFAVFYAAVFVAASAGASAGGSAAEDSVVEDFVVADSTVVAALTVAVNSSVIRFIELQTPAARCKPLTTRSCQGLYSSQVSMWDEFTYIEYTNPSPQIGKIHQ